MFKFSLLCFVILAISCKDPRTSKTTNIEIEDKLFQLQEENAHLRLALELCQNEMDDRDKKINLKLRRNDTSYPKLQSKKIVLNEDLH